MGKLELIEEVLKQDTNEPDKLLLISNIIDSGKSKNIRMKIEDILLSEMKNDSQKIREIKEVLTKVEVKPLYSIQVKGKIKYSNIPWRMIERELMTLDISFKEYQEVKRLYPLIPKSRTSQYDHVWHQYFPFWLILRNRGRSIPEAAKLIFNGSKARFGNSPSQKTIVSNMKRIEKALKLK
jgi:hypothetical protein